MVALIGRMRLEKGAARYSEVIREALAFPGASVVAQVSSEGVSMAEREIACALLDDWAYDPRVTVIDGHIEPLAYVGWLSKAQVVVLPYDVASYGDGTSGVLNDALSVGCVVVATRTRWAVDRFEGDPRVVWLDAGADGLRTALSEALRRAAEIRRAASPSVDLKFAEAWHDVIDGASSSADR
jgi:glycosyltransferase involved in cell wall biosynthesis